MYVSERIMGAIVAAALLAPASPAFAQSRDRANRVADEIARGVEATADAVGTVTDAIFTSVNGIRFRAAERFAINRCAPRVERYGRMRVEHVEPYRRRSWRVHGSTDPRSYGAYSSRNAPRAFTCTVREDGRVKLKTKRYRAG